MFVLVHVQVLFFIFNYFLYILKLILDTREGNVGSCIFVVTAVMMDRSVSGWLLFISVFLML